MFKLAGYTNFTILHKGSQNLVYSAMRESDNQEVVVKVLRSLNPSINQIALMFHEYEVTKDLDLPGVIKTYALVEEQNHYALIQENIQGISLSDYIKEHPINELSVFYPLALQMVAIIDQIHRKHIIHKDVKPGNFIIEPKSSTIKLTDFNFAAKLRHEVQNLEPPEKLEGTLAYISPEQTGRMNMNIDYRTDYYSLGVTFFELLAQRLPFQHSDPLEMVHAHLATTPPDASELNPSTPKFLARIVAKLMAKDPAERYQSAAGILKDLEHCIKGATEFQLLGQSDLSDRLNISQKLYGREEEVKVLLATYERVIQGSVEALMCCGYSGIGKTMLINQVHKLMCKPKGYFISGKFDLLQRNTPYTAITQAFNQLASLILSEPEETFERIKKSLQQALGGVAQVIIDLAPDLEKILGPQPPLDKVPPQETQNRMMIFFKRFLETIATPESPLVLFIDDLQWADSGTLKLLEYILTDSDLSHVLLIGAYRDNEVDSHHPLQLLFKDRAIQFLRLPPLTPTNFEALLRDSFSRDDCSPLAELLYKRTDGNPFFCKQLIGTLYQKDLLHFDYENRKWDWNLDEIQKLTLAENVVDLILAKLSELPGDTQSLLQYAACVGSRFTIELLQVITGMSIEAIVKALWPAMEKELIATLNLGYKKLDALSLETTKQSLSKEIIFQFTHDRIQQAAYQSISEDEKQKTHLTIARMLLQKEPEACKKTALFELTDHFNKAFSLLDKDEKMVVVRLNYDAAVQARNANGYDSMMNYLTSALGLLTEESWNTHYDLMFSINRECALANYLLGKNSECETLVKNLLAKAKTNLDKVSLYRIAIMNYLFLGEFAKIFDTSKIALSLLGVKFLTNPTKLDILLKWVKVRWKLRRFHAATIDEELPVLTDPSVVAAFEIFGAIRTACFYKSINLISYLIMTGIDLLLTYGKSKYAGSTLFSYGLSNQFIFNNLDSPLKYWQSAKRLLDEAHDKFISCNSLLGMAIFVVPFHNPLKEAESYYQKAILDSLESGNILTLISAKESFATHIFAQAKSCKRALEAAILGNKACSDVNYKYDQEHQKINIIFFENFLLGEHKNEDVLKALEEKTTQSPSLYIKIMTLRNLSYYYFFTGDYDKVIHYHQSWYPHESIVKYHPLSYETKTTNALAIYNSLSKVHGFPKRSLQKRFTQLVRELQWISEKCPVNYLHHYLFLKAMQLRANECFLEALSELDKAIINAKKGDFYLWAALGNELAGDMLMTQEQTRAAELYIREAHYYYELYGMTMKSKAIKTKYPSCFLEHDLAIPLKEETSGTSTMRTTSSGLDIASVIKASQSISGEIVLERLFEIMLHISIENAGAQKTVFIEQRHDQWHVTAFLVHHKDSDQFTICNTPLNQFQDVPQLIINAAIRTKEPLLIDNPNSDPRFSLDAYITRIMPKSTLCLPIIHHDTLIGVMYLENNLTAGVFTKERISVLQTLAAQMAISLENARHVEEIQLLYKSTERFVPKAFLKLLKKEHVQDVKLGDSTEMMLTVLFTDIRGYTTITENQSPQEAFGFINSYLNVMAPIIRANNGFINQYQGDGIMALFPYQAEDGINAVLSLAKALDSYNLEQQKQGKPILHVGYGLNTGLAMLGTIGEEERMDANVISDAINLASRVESLNKFYGTIFLISDTTHSAISDKNRYLTRIVDKVVVKGKKKPVTLYEVYLDGNVDTNERAFIKKYENAFKEYEKGNFIQALTEFKECQRQKPNDACCQLFIERCLLLIKSPPLDKWDGTYEMTNK